MLKNLENYDINYPENNPGSVPEVNRMLCGRFGTRARYAGQDPDRGILGVTGAKHVRTNAVVERVLTPGAMAIASGPRRQ